MSISSIPATPNSVEIKIWAPLAEVDEMALAQLRNVASLPRIYKHVSSMADVHGGYGAAVGSVVAQSNALSPSMVGVDIGCGMDAVRTSLKASDLPENLEALRAAIEAAVPVGRDMHQNPIPEHCRAIRLFARFNKLVPEVQGACERAGQQMGTLGSGNHFIEVCVDEEQNVWLMLHSGSRNIGHQISTYHCEVAQGLLHNKDLADPSLAYFLSNTEEMRRYRHDLEWAQEYAYLNRSVMLSLVKNALLSQIPGVTFAKPISCHHNYVAEEYHFGESVFVTRKGAIRAGRGELGIIPGSMGTRSYIVRGRGNPDSFESASHGAGRVMSRAKAKKTFTVADFVTQTQGVCCNKSGDFIDEIPGAYKDIDQVMANQADLVEVVATIKQVLCVKG